MAPAQANGKLLVLVSTLGGGGAERVATLLCNHWAAAGLPVGLVATYPDDTTTPFPVHPDVSVLSVPGSAGRKTAWSQLRRLRALRQLIKQQRATSVIAFLTNVNVAAILATRGLDTTVVVSERIHPPNFPIGRALQVLRWLTYPLAAGVVVQTRTTQRWFAERIPRAKTQVIANPLALPLPKTNPLLPITSILQPDQALLLAVGRLDPQKGFADLVQAFAELATRHPQWQLVILGDGPERTRLAQQIEAQQLSGRAHLPGWAGNIGEWYERADLFALSSHFEGFPNVLLEAMGHGVASVAYDCPAGPAELLGASGAGTLVPLAAGVGGLATALTALMTDANKRADCAERARQRAQQFAPEEISAEWLALLEAGDP